MVKIRERYKKRQEKNIPYLLWVINNLAESYMNNFAES